MSVFLQRIDSVPLQSDELTPELKSWLGVLVDTLNSTFTQLEGQFNNGIIVPQKTTTEINEIAPDAPNGTMWYDTTTQQTKQKINGSVVVIAP